MAANAVWPSRRKAAKKSCMPTASASSALKHQSSSPAPAAMEAIQLPPRNKVRANTPTSVAADRTAVTRTARRRSGAGDRHESWHVASHVRRSDSGKVAKIAAR